jgi:hypothetical protein
LAFARQTIAEASGRTCRIQRILQQNQLAPVQRLGLIQVECELKASAGNRQQFACRFRDPSGLTVARADLIVEFLS